MTTLALVAGLWGGPLLAASEPLRSAISRASPRGMDAVLADLRSDGVGDARLVVLRFVEPLGPDARARMAERGVLLDAAVPPRAYFALVPDTVSADQLREGGVDAALALAADARCHPLLAQRVAERGRIRVCIRYVAGALEYGLLEQLHAFKASEVSVIPELCRIDCDLEPAALRGLVELPLLRWVEAAPTDLSVDNDGVLQRTGGDRVAGAPYSLSGGGLTVAMWEAFGPPDVSHPDLLGRCTVIEGGITSVHGTHVAGSLIGSGVGSTARGGTNGQWRGVAPTARLRIYDAALAELEMNNAMNVGSAVVAQNAWGLNVDSANCAVYGDYSTQAAAFDDVIAGRVYGPGIPVVFSAGNERNDGDCGMSGSPYINYGNISPPRTAKNVLAVGASYSNADTLPGFTSWGPTDDGRLKPDLVAPGDQIAGDGGVMSTTTNSGYEVLRGTSMAASQVSGAIALLLEDHRTRYPGARLLPATLRALLLHTAVDLDAAGLSWLNAGPDYASGYGRLHVPGAVDQLRSGSFAEGVLAAAVTNTYVIPVPASASGPRVTLVWDDPAGAENVSPALVNDLDLIVRDPSGVRHFPWTLDPSNPSSPASRSGEDHTNVIEQVDVAGPVVSGIWTARVVGTSISIGPTQTYALVWSPQNTVTIDARASGPGSVSPSGPVPLFATGRVDFAVTANAYYHIASVASNGSSIASLVGAEEALIPWDPVGTGGTVFASFSAALTTNATPHWWLATHGWTSNFEAVSLRDDDRDGMDTWREWRGGTDPTQRDSVLGLRAPEGVGDRRWRLQWRSVSGRLYSVWVGTNGLVPMRVASNLAAIPPMNTYTTETVSGRAPMIRVSTPEL